MAMILPMKFPDRRAALLGAFCNRLVLGTIFGALIGWAVAAWGI